MNNWKFVALLRKRDDLTREQFIDYYERQHVPLILSLFPMIAYYRRNFADFSSAYVYPNAAPFDFDCVTEIGFASEADFRAMEARSADPEVLARIGEDEKNFLDQSHTRMFRVDEYETRRAE